MTLDEALLREAMSRKIGTPRFRLNFPPEDVFRLLHAFYVAEVEHRGNRCVFNDFTLDRLWSLALAITDPSPKFGIMLCGSYGNGKSTMLLTFQSAMNYLLDKGHIGKDVWPGMEICCAKDLAYYAKRNYDKYMGLRKRRMLAIDDYGEEPKEVKDYGDILEPIVDLIEYRYNHQLFTMATTNLSPSDFKEVYNGRLADRLREMMTVISFGNERSFRK